MLIVLTILNIIEKRYIRAYQVITVVVTARENPALVETLLEVFKKLKKKVLNIGFEADPIKKSLTVNLVVKTLEDDPMIDIREAIETIPGVTHYKLN
jgi:uncharacterized protein YjhX (UPF0386 family)